MPTDETLYVITEGDETPQQVVLDLFAGQPRTWKGPYRDRNLAIAYLRQHLASLSTRPRQGYYQVHTFSLAHFQPLMSTVGFSLFPNKAA